MALYSWDQAWLQARETADAALCLLTIHHPMIETFRLVRNPVAITSRGDVYSPSYFDINVVNDNDQLPRATISIPGLGDVGRKINFELAKLVDPPEISIEVISSAHLDEPIYRAARLELRAIHIDELTISGELGRTDYGTETCGTIRVVPSKFPALFRRRG